MTTIDLDYREISTVLAALRHWQAEDERHDAEAHGIATDDGTIDSLTDDEIDALCERINTTDPVAPDVPELVVEFHYDDGDVGAHPLAEVSDHARHLWPQFSQSTIHDASHIVIRRDDAAGQALSTRLHEAARPAPGPALRVRYVCETCGGDRLTKDATAEWDETAQRWDLAAVYDATTCADCESETFGRRVEIA
jgi:hypothetical protein